MAVEGKRRAPAPLDEQLGGQRATGAVAGDGAPQPAQVSRRLDGEGDGHGRGWAEGVVVGEHQVAMVDGRLVHRAAVKGHRQGEGTARLDGRRGRLGRRPRDVAVEPAKGVAPKARIVGLEVDAIPEGLVSDDKHLAAAHLVDSGGGLPTQVIDHHLGGAGEGHRHQVLAARQSDRANALRRGMGVDVVGHAAGATAPGEDNVEHPGHRWRRSVFTAFVGDKEATTLAHKGVDGVQLVEAIRHVRKVTEEEDIIPRQGGGRDGASRPEVDRGPERLEVGKEIAIVGRIAAVEVIEQDPRPVDALWPQALDRVG